MNTLRSCYGDCVWQQMDNWVWSKILYEVYMLTSMDEIHDIVYYESTSDELDKCNCSEPFTTNKVSKICLYLS